MATPGLITNHPGLMQSYGVPFLPNEFVGTGGKIFWVGNRSTLPAGDGSKPEYPLSTVNAALAKCVSGRQDIVYVLPGHAENISAASGWSSLVAGTKVIGLGTGVTRPAFTWTAALGTIAIAVANVRIQNCQFFCAGDTASTTALTVAAGFPITAAGVQLVNNYIQCGVDADQLTTNCITLSAAADDFTLQGNEIIGGPLAVITSVMVTAGAVDRLFMINNNVSAAPTTQLFDFSNAACVDHRIIGNRLANTTASSNYVIKPHATTTGIVDGNTWYVTDGTTAPAVSGFTTFTTTYQFGLNYCVTTTAKSAILCPAADS